MKVFMVKNNFQLDAPLQLLDAYFDLYKVEEKTNMLTFARSKIPGFDLIWGFGYYECKITAQESDYGLKIEPHNKFVLMDDVSY